MQSGRLPRDGRQPVAAPSGRRPRWALVCACSLLAPRLFRFIDPQHHISVGHGPCGRQAACPAGLASGRAAVATMRTLLLVLATVALLAPARVSAATQRRNITVAAGGHRRPLPLPPLALPGTHGTLHKMQSSVPLCSPPPGHKLDKRCDRVWHSSWQPGQRTAGILSGADPAVLQVCGWHANQVAPCCQACPVGILTCSLALQGPAAVRRSLPRAHCRLW